MKSILTFIPRLLAAACAVIVLLNPIHGVVYANSDLSPTELERAIDKVVSENMNLLHIPGAAVVVTKGTSTILSKGYGYADLENKTTMNPAKSVVRIGSLTKSMTATAAMQLVERNQLELNRDVNAYLNTYKVPLFGKQPITMHHLLTHSAGLDQAVYAVNSLSVNNSLAAVEYLRAYFQKQPPVREPGTKYEYSNVGLGLVGNLIEQTQDQSLNDYMKQNVFHPLEMPSATLELPLHNADLVKSYTFGKAGYTANSYSYISLPGAGAMNVIPNEFAHYMICHLNGGQYNGHVVLTKETVDVMHAQQFAAHPQMDGLGYGFFRGELGSGIPMLWATGEIDSFVSKMVLVPSENLGLYVVANSSAAGLELHNLVLDAVCTFLNAQPTKYKQLDEGAGAIDTKTLAGDYQTGINPEHGWGKWLRFLGGFSFKVKAEDAQTVTVSGLFPDREEKQDKKFVHLGDGLFQETGGWLQIYFHKLDGDWALTDSENVTVPKVTFLEKTRTLLSMYIASALFFIIIFAVWLFRYVVCLLKRTSKPVSGGIATIALLNTVFFCIQFSYGNAQITYGYPFWYIWGISALPFFSAAVAITILIKHISGLYKESLKSLWGIIFSAVTLLITGFLFYWNLFPVHYS
ncbi:serine hydrolase domain-containing protein [Paenibacillus sp. SI8]|uniref:serine hydrolase domain-containing protein n=1 Tax=unclassified Paenibacillus TaxID=185978 RepID=UPI00346707A8